jgi:hypothetical protein
LEVLKLLREKFAENEANEQTFSWVDSCCAGGSTKARWTAAHKGQGGPSDRRREKKKKKEKTVTHGLQH